MHIYKSSHCSNGSSEVRLNQMIVDKTYHLKLTTPVTDITEVWPVFNDSFALLGKNNLTPTILHLDCEGKQLYRYIFYGLSSSLCWIDDRQIAAATRDNQDCITLINFQTKRVIHIPHKLLNFVQLIDIYYFPDAKRIQVDEECWNSEHKYTLYSLQNIQKQIEPFHFQNQQFDEINIQSMVPQVEYIRQHKILITIYDLKGEAKKERRKGRQRIPKKIFIKNKSLEQGDYKAWRIGENKLLLSYFNPKSFKQNLREIYQGFIVDLQQQTLRVPNFFLEKEEMIFSSTIDNIGDFSVFAVEHERDDNNQHISCTIYFVCHQTESVIKKVQFKQSYPAFSQYTYTNPRNTLLLVEQKSNGQRITDLVVRKFQVEITKDQYLYLMLGIYEEFDDDLLYDAITLLMNQN